MGCAPLALALPEGLAAVGGEPALCLGPPVRPGAGDRMVIVRGLCHIQAAHLLGTGEDQPETERWHQGCAGGQRTQSYTWPDSPRFLSASRMLSCRSPPLPAHAYGHMASRADH